MTLFKLANDVMEALPLAHTVADRVFIVHGGLARHPNFMVSDLDSVERGTSVPEGDSLLSDILWSDPRDSPGIHPSPRGGGVFLGPDVTEAFLERNNLKLIIRSHEVDYSGNGFLSNHDGKCITVFSALDYGNYHNYYAAVIELDPSAQAYTVHHFGKYNDEEWEKKAKKLI